MNIDNDDEGEGDDGAQYELNWMSLLNGCFIGANGLKVLAVKAMSLLIAGVTLPDHKKRHNAMMILSKKIISCFLNSFWHFLKLTRKINQKFTCHEKVSEQKYVH